MLKLAIKGLICVIWTMFLPCTLAAVSHSSSHNVMEVVDEQVDPMKGQAIETPSNFSDTADSFAMIMSILHSSNELNFSYCQEIPKFRLGSGSLLTYMMRLKLCYIAANRPWFKAACQDWLYGFTDYHRAVYIKFCNPLDFQRECGIGVRDEADTILQSWMRRHNLTEVITSKYDFESSGVSKAYKTNKTVNKIDKLHCNPIQSFFETLKIDEIRKAHQIADYNASSKRDLIEPFYDVPFTEWFLTYRVFCEPVACGVSQHSYQNYSLSAYDCFPSSCQSAIIFTMAFDSILAFIIVAANLLVLAVAFRTTVMRNIPGYFKISLAVSDLMIGLFVLPGSVYHHYVLSIAPLPYRGEGQTPQSTDYFTQGYLDFMGLFTILSFSVSIYTMGAASVDRYLAITKPFQYKKGKFMTKKRSVAVFALIWIFGFVIAFYPIIIKSYNISALGLVLSTGFDAIVIYAVTLGLPLVAVWLINGAMLRQVCSEKKTRRNLSISRSKSAQKKATANIAARSVSVQEEALNKQQPPSDTFVDDDVFEADNSYKSNNNYKPSDYNYRRKMQTVNSGQNRFTNFASTVQSKFKKLRKSSTSSITSQANVERRLTKTLGIMIGAFTMAILPCILVLGFLPALTMLITPTSFPKTYSPAATNSYTTAEYFASRLFLSNSFWNCIIYSIRNRHFRRALTDVFIWSEDRRRQKRHAMMAGSVSSYRAPRNRPLSKVASNDSFGIPCSTTQKRRQTQIWDLSCASRTNSYDNKAMEQ